jgi:hypothetical protein
VRVRLVTDPNKQATLAHYHIGVVVGWKQHEERESQGVLNWIRRGKYELTRFGRQFWTEVVAKFSLIAQI